MTTYQVTLPIENDPRDAVKNYDLSIERSVRDIDGIYIVTYVGTRENISTLLDEFGGEENCLAVMEAPLGRISEIVRIDL